MKNKVVGVVLALVLVGVMGSIAVVGFLNYRNSETKDRLNYEEAYGISENEYVVIFNNEQKDYRAVEFDGQVYLPLEQVRAELNGRFYWDANENILIYTRPSGNVLAWPDQTQYSDALQGQQELGYAPLRDVDGRLYIAVEYVKLFTKCDIDAYTKPNRLVIRNRWEELPAVTVSEDTALRYRGGVKAEVLRDLTAGETLYVLDDSYDEWTFVASSDGYTGWVADKYIGESLTQAPPEPDFAEDVYTGIQRDHKIKMVWHQMMTTPDAEKFETDFADVIGMNVTSPTWFAFNDTDGTIRSIASEDYVRAAHDDGMEVWALFSNQFPDENGELKGFEGTGVPTDEVLAYTSKREFVITQLIDACRLYGIDGVNLDFENIMSPSEDGTGQASENYIQFVRELSVACHQNNLVLSVDISVPLYTQHYNWAEQGVFADYVAIMAYDEYYAGRAEAGPVASIGFVEQGITDALGYGIPASKIINGIPFYSRYWYSDSEGILYYGGEATMHEAQGYVADHGVTPEWNEEFGVSYASYDGVDGNFYEFYIEDLNSVDRKLQVVTKYDLGGISCWKLGQEDSDVWVVIAAYLP